MLGSPRACVLPEVAVYSASTFPAQKLSGLISASSQSDQSIFPCEYLRRHRLEGEEGAYSAPLS